MIKLLLDCLFNAVRSVILRMFYQMNKSKNFVPGFICVLHTFGRPLEWNKYIKNPPEGMTAKLVKNMSDSDLLDMHYFLTEDDDWDGDEPEEGFYIDLFQ